jgi:uncharacterized protein (TIRG00374 family)
VKKLKEKVYRLLPVLGLSLFVAIVWRVGPFNIVTVFRSIDLYYLALTPFFLLVVILLKGLKWKLILSNFDISLPLKKACMMWAMGFSAGGVTPGRIGEVIRATYLNRDTGEPYGECLSTVAVDKILELISLIILFIPSALYLSMRSTVKFSLVGIAVLLSMIVMTLYLITNYEVMRKILNPLARIFIRSHHRESLEQHFSKFFRGIEKLRLKRQDWILPGFLAILTWLVIFLHMYTLAASLKMDVSPCSMFILLPTIQFVAILPISLSGIGPRDAAAILLFSAMGISKDTAVAWSILCVVAGLWSFVFVGWLLMMTSYPMGRHIERPDQS